MMPRTRLRDSSTEAVQHCRFFFAIKIRLWGLEELVGLLDVRVGAVA